MQAFKARKTEVTIRDGRKFVCDYDVRPFVLKTTGEVRKVVHVQPANGEFAPSGFFNLKEVTSPDWVKQNQRDIQRDTLPNIKDVKVKDGKV